MKLGSLFDGSGGFPLAGQMCGIEPVWASEIEPYPIAVTKNRFPNMKHLGDISKINGAEIEPVDIVCAGSPCQDLSVAGLRKGIKHETKGDEETTRSGLFMESVRIIKEMREATNGEFPAVFIWENVCGAFSSNRGEDFRSVLEELIRIIEPDAVMPPVPKKGWAYADCYDICGRSLAYRTFDAQYWGVPQRRRRIHLVVDFRGKSASQILFEREGVYGYFEKGISPWQATSRNAERGIGTADRERTPYLLKIRSGCEGGGKGALIQEDLSATLATNNDQYLFQPVPNAIGADIYNLALTGDVAASLTTATGQGASNTGPSVLDILLDDQGGQQISVRTDGKSPTLRAEMHGNVPCVMDKVYSIENHPADSRVNIDESGKVQTLTSRMGTGGGNVPLVMEPAAVYAVDQGGGKSGANFHKEKSPTLTCTHGGEPVIAFDRAAFNQGINAQYDFEVTDSGIASTLVAKGPSGVAYEEPVNTYQKVTGPLMANSHPGSYTGQDAFSDMLVAGEQETRYVVRRLTPTECARLQGFPDWWGHFPEKDDFTDEEYAFWLDVRNTHAEINGKTVKEYTKEQMVKWYNKLHTDSAEYKCWGNGIALPPAIYCMQGIVEALQGGGAK